VFPDDNEANFYPLLEYIHHMFYVLGSISPMR